MPKGRLPRDNAAHIAAAWVIRSRFGALCSGSLIAGSRWHGVRAFLCVATPPTGARVVPMGRQFDAGTKARIQNDDCNCKKFSPAAGLLWRKSKAGGHIARRKN